MQGSNGLKSPITIPAFKIQKMKSVNYFWDLMKDAHFIVFTLGFDIKWNLKSQFFSMAHMQEGKMHP